MTPAPELAEQLGLSWCGLKRDDLIAELHGGTKVRKLDYLLALPAFAEAPGWTSWGAIGSGHLVALTAAARELGKTLEAHTFWEPLGEEVLEKLAFLASGPTRIRYHGTRPGLLLGAPRALLGQVRGRRLVPPGATTPAGIAGVVRGGLELAAQVEAGQLPVPDHLYVALGTGGTLVGLLLGLGLAGLRPVVHAVSAVERPLIPKRLIDSLLLRTRAWLERQGLTGFEQELPELRLDHAHVGPGYGIASEGSSAATLRLKEWGFPFEPLYSGKAMASLIAAPPQGSNVLFWLTPRSGDPLPHTEDWRARLPAELRRRLPPRSYRGPSRRAVLVGGLALVAGGGWWRTHGYPARPDWRGRQLSSAQAHVLAAVAEALLPPAPDEGRWASIPARADRFLATMPPHLLLEVDALLLAVEQGTTPLGHSFSRLSSLSPAQREAYLSSLADAGGLRRLLYQSIRDMCLLGYYQQPETWAALGYEGPRVGPEPRSDAYQGLLAGAGVLPAGYRTAS